MSAPLVMQHTRSSDVDINEGGLEIEWFLCKPGWEESARRTLRARQMERADATFAGVRVAEQPGMVCYHVDGFSVQGPGNLWVHTRSVSRYARTYKPVLITHTWA